MARKNRTKRGNLGCMLGERKAESDRHHGTAEDRHAETLASKPLSCGDTQINGYGLN